MKLLLFFACLIFMAGCDMDKRESCIGKIRYQDGEWCCCEEKKGE